MWFLKNDIYNSYSIVVNNYQTTYIYENYAAIDIHSDLSDGEIIEDICSIANIKNISILIESPSILTIQVVGKINNEYDLESYITTNLNGFRNALIDTHKLWQDHFKEMKAKSWI